VTPTIVFDFDGTLALGAGPILAYARAAARRADDPAFFDRAVAALAAFEAGEAAYRDGYDAVGSLAVEAGIDASVLEESYSASRAVLGSADAPVVAPAGLAPFLARVGRHAQILLATNAPGDSILPLLSAWDVADTFDGLHFAVGKPEGLRPILAHALEEGPVLSVGDIVDLDLVPAMELGADTALVGATAARSSAPVTMRGATLSDLYAEIEAWAATAASSPSRTTPIERHS
jgi:phosphoglycolate phosphatase-like HAD superfamily hydrolase